jgi:hypothetical protein
MTKKKNILLGVLLYVVNVHPVSFIEVFATRVYCSNLHPGSTHLHRKYSVHIHYIKQYTLYMFERNRILSDFNSKQVEIQ